MSNFKKAIALALALCGILMMTSCATERDAVDKSPERALDKKLFEGEFFYRMTVTDLPYQADYGFIGESSDGKIIKWKITENWLIAYNVHDFLSVTNSAEVPIINETPVLTYPIYDHYDIVPAENPTTGEDMPLLSTNRDRPWHQRRYFQIDMSRSATINFELKYQSLNALFGYPYFRSGVAGYYNLEFYAHDGSYVNPKNYTEVAAKDPQKEVEWFQFYNKEFLDKTPHGSYYTWDDIDEFYPMEPNTITYRHYFRKVNRDVYGRRTYDPKTQKWTWKKGSKDNGFRPMEHPDELFRKFGYFLSRFKGYDPENGYKEENYHRLANYFNIAWGTKTNDGVKWNQTCDDANWVVTEGSAEDVMGQLKTFADEYEACVDKKVHYQKKLATASSPVTPLRMLPIDCAIIKDYNHSMLSARFAAMAPNSDTRVFFKWYRDKALKNEIKDFMRADGSRSTDWWMCLNNEGKYDPNRAPGCDYKADTDDYKIIDSQNLANAIDNWKEQCFIPESAGRIQNWDGSLKEDNYTNDIVAIIENPVVGHIEARDGKHNRDYNNYDDDQLNGEENALFICVSNEDAEKASPDKLSYFSNCETNAAVMKAKWEKEYNREWRGEGFDCRIIKKDEACKKAAYPVKVKVACVKSEERTCKIDKVGAPKLRHKYELGDHTVAMLNWVDTPTEYGILGVSQWSINPETGESLSGGSQIAGSVLQWVATRAVELARLTMDDTDPAKWDWEQFLNPDYQDHPEVIFNNNPGVNTLTRSTDDESVKAEIRDYMKANRHKLVLGNDKPVEKDFLKLSAKLREDLTSKNRFNLNSIKGTRWETEMVPYSVRKTLFPWIEQGDVYDDDMKTIMTPFYSMGQFMKDEMDRQVKRDQEGYFEASFLDGALIHFLRERRDKYKDDNDAYIASIYRDLELLLYKGVAQHEMGHTLGLRHNFIGSADITNYDDRYFSKENYPRFMDDVKEKFVEPIYKKYNYDNDEERWKERKKLASDYKKFDEELAAILDTVDKGIIPEEFVQRKKELDARKENLDKFHFEMATLGEKIFRYKRGDKVINTDKDPEINDKDRFVSDMNYYTYSSVMEYQREPYIHSVGLGKYDYAAFKMVYGRSLEKYNLKDDGSITMDATNAFGIRDPRYKYPVLVNTPFIEEDGTLTTVPQNERIESRLPNGGKKIVIVPAITKYDPKMGISMPSNDASAPGLATKERAKGLLISDPIIHKYLFFADEKQNDEPANKVFDSGMSGADMIRGMRAQADSFYFLRYFRRGNPRFRDFRGSTSYRVLIDTYFQMSKYLHYMLDLNYNAFYGWWKHFPVNSPGTFTTVPSNYSNCRNVVIAENTQGDYKDFGPDPLCVDYIKATDGIEYWLNENGDLETLTPLGPGDYLIAGMEGVNTLMFDMLYRPDVTEYIMFKAGNDPFEKERIGGNQQGMYRVSSYAASAEYIANAFDVPVVDVNAQIGRYHKERYDIQDNPEIYYEKIQRRGWAVDQMIAANGIANTGWFSGKYRRESMSNSIYTQAKGIEKVMYTMFADIANEDSIASLSPYCVKRSGDVKFQKLSSKDIVKAQLPVNYLLRFGELALYDGTDNSFWKRNVPVNICSELVDPNDPDAVYEPIHAGWQYFDKMYPLYWGMGSVMNTSADTTILLAFYTMTYNSHEKNLYPEADVDEIEALNYMGNRYYRAKIPSIQMSKVDRELLAHWKLCNKGTHVDAGGAEVENDKLWCIRNYTKAESGVKLFSPQFDGVGDEFENNPDQLLREYFRTTYSKQSPAFRLVYNLKLVGKAGKGDLTADPSNQKLTIMETTLDQMNSFVNYHFKSAVQYVNWF